MNVIRCIATAAALVVATVQAQSSEPANAPGATASKPNGALIVVPFPTEESPFPVKVIEHPGSAAHSQTREAKSDKHDAEDLEAQIRTANAAEKQVFAAWAAAIFSFLSTVLLVLTVRESRRAATAAEQSVAHARAVAEKQLRAYVNIVDAYAEWSDEKDVLLRRVCVTVRFKNCGQTPAHDVAGWAKVTSADPLRVEFPPEELDGTFSVDGPGMTNFFLRWHQASQSLVEDELNVWKRGETALFVYGQIVYRDAFGEPRRTDFRLAMPRHSIGDKSGSFTPCRSGNGAT